MKNRVKYLIAIITCLCVFSTTNVYASNATGGVTSNGKTDCSIKYTGIDAKGQYVENKCHSNYDIEINYNGKKYEGFCADLNKTLSGGQNPFTCEEVADSAIAYLLSSGYSRNEITAALRTYTTGIENSSVNANQLLSNAQSGAGLSVTKVAENGNVVTYQVSTTLNNVSFTCGAGCSSVSYSGNTLTVTLEQGACSYSFSATYSGTVSTTSNGKVIRCHSQNIQNVYILEVSESSSSNTTTSQGGVTTQTFSGNLENTNSDYYKQYCNGPQQPNVCTEKTEIKKPEFCDDDKDQSISITSPKNVKYCVLNSNDDVGNTYQMLDGQVDEKNPYCAVYCKEDYKMTMPGAQYANSGRYFELKNTKVEATRTCYTTNPSSDKNKTNIDTSQYVKDVIAAQQEVAKAKTELEKAKKERDIPAQDHDSSNCDGSHSTWYSKSREDYPVYGAIGCNQTTGICTISQTGIERTTLHEWGTEYGCDKGKCSNYPLCTNYTPDTNTSKIRGYEPNWDAIVNEKTNALNAAVSNLKRIIALYEQCYNWTNNLCLDTIVEFEYDEQYSGDINYEKVSQTIDKDKEVGYSTIQTIDSEYTATGVGSLRQYDYPSCDTNGCNQKITTKNISFTDTHVKKVSVGNAEYANTQEFQTNYPSGSIETVSNPSAVKHNYSYLGAVFPIALNTSKGVYQWTLNFSGLGQYNDTGTTQCKNGRLDAVLGAVSTPVEYVCVYVVSCDDCDYECVGDGCLIESQPKCPECDVYCVNCIFDGDTTYVYQAKSLNELVVHGSNWTTEKGEETKKEIEENGEDIYINALYTYRIDANMMKAIRDYNKETGTYVEQDLTYHDLNGVKNAYGTSEFLRNEKNENKYFKTITRNEDWTLWTGATGSNTGTSWKVGK